MPTNPCSDEPKLVAQTMFLGASVSSFNNSVGWGSQSSQLTVNLVEDDFAYDCANPPTGPKDTRNSIYSQFGTVGASPTNPRLAGYDDNHYHTCGGDENIECYVDKFTGDPAIKTGGQNATPIENRILPGKVYYALTETGGLVSRYWTGTDPGFFGKKTRIDHNGGFSAAGENSHPSLFYDIIDTPVYFKMGDFQFGGFVQSWSNSVSTGGKNFSVTINGPQSILNSCYVIVDKFGGSLFNKGSSPATAGSSIYGSPKNYLGYAGVNHNITDIYKGALPNVFNVYGFLESLGVHNFGVARPNENGISINKVLDALMVLTSVSKNSAQKLDTRLRSTADDALKTAFSTFGRIISKSMQREDYRANPGSVPNSLFSPITSNFNEFGVVYPQPLHSKTDTTRTSNRCQFVLDLNELIYDNIQGGPKRMPDDIRIPGPVITIMELINLVAEQTGQDIYVDMVPVVEAGTLYHCIKVKTISRLQQPRTNAIDSTIKLLQCSGYPVSSNTVGKEKNETPSRAMIIGGQQQRLLQVSSYRLAYTQSNFIYDPKNKMFINYFSLKDGAIVGDAMPTVTLTQNYGFGKVRFPNFNSTRNSKISDTIGSSNLLESYYTDILKDETNIQDNLSLGWEKEDAVWRSDVELREGVKVQYGNYRPSYKSNHTALNDANGGARWFPLHLDNICPFFGYVYDEEASMKVESGSDNSNTSFREVRPVWFDTWTGQIALAIRINELPTLSLPLTRRFLQTSSKTPQHAMIAKEFPLPYLANLPNPTTNTAFNNLGPVAAYNPVEFFVLTESEIRAALAGFDNFLVYSLAKTYKPDLIELIRRAYFIETREKLQTQLRLTLVQAEKQAAEETDWYWKLLGSNIGGDTMYPTVVSPDKGDGSQYIQEKALQDLKLIHGFVSEIGKYYGKKYMVFPGQGLQSYRDESLSNIAFPTNVGYGYIFAGDGKITYNYTPTNDGAWEEYGNIIDDSMAVGGTQWYTLSDDQGKIRPILGYNNNYQFDYIRQAKCEASKSTNFITDFSRDGANPYFSYSSWLTLEEHKRTSCIDTFVFPSLDTSSLSSTDYVVVDQFYSSAFPSISTLPTGFFPQPGVAATSLSALSLSTKVTSYDPWNKVLTSGNGTAGGGNNIMPRSKLYVPTSVEENYIFLDASTLLGARILMDSPGVFLNVSSTENAKDPNRTVIANIAAEDLIIYMKTTQKSSWDWDWIRYMLNYISPASYADDDANPHFLGAYAVSSNSAANNVELAPKAAHPFFAGVPIRSNQFVYGPWTNYPLTDYTGIYPTGITVSQTSAIPPICTDVAIHQPTFFESTQALDNLITSMDITVDSDFVPWNYGGMHYLDMVAFKDIETKINYQSVIETAQVDMPGLPLFGLGGVFSLDNMSSSIYKSQTTGLIYYDAKETSWVGPDLSYIPGAKPAITASPTGIITAEYTTIGVTGIKSPPGPIISNIQCSIGQNGISTSYNFRTYTRKIGLFNKEESDRIKKISSINLKRNKQMSQLSQEIANINRQQQKTMTDDRLNKSQFGSSDLSSKLFGWSPSMVLIGQAAPYIAEPGRTPQYIEDYSFNSVTENFNSRPGAPTAWSVPTGLDQGDREKNNASYLTTNASATTLSNIGRVVTTVQLYERKEVGAQLDKDYGMQSAMSLDGLLSPVSFYPTYKNATFSYSLHNTTNCPFCNGAKVRKIKLVQYDNGGGKIKANNGAGIFIVCDKCGTPGERLNAKINTNNEEIPINLITLNPIVVANGEFRNINTQNYTGAHPDGAHDDISSESPGLNSQPRHFRDRLRHCIEIVARGSVPQSQSKYALETSKNLTAHTKHAIDVPQNNLDYARYDLQLFSRRDKAKDPNNILYENNQRFFGLRGPLVLHSWGYDEEGYPVPNAADEPFATDIFGRPKRFKLKKKIATDSKKYKALSEGEMFQLSQQGDQEIFSKTFNDQNLPSAWNALTALAVADTLVYVVTIEDDLADAGGFDPGSPAAPLNYTAGYKGSIISKTQKYLNGRWTEKVKLNDFYLNWAERPDLWRVGPIDLTWDDKRKVWVGGQGCGEESPPFILTNSNDIDTINDFLLFKKETNCPYRDIYATLEEDLIKQPDFDETYATRAFIDDTEFSKQPLQQGYRRLIYVKDKCGYCAPRGTKLLCKYNKYTGFYEPISKPVLVAKGLMNGGNRATIQMHYIQGRRSGVVPTSVVAFDNPLGFTFASNAVAMFTFLNGKWTLTSIKQ